MDEEELGRGKRCGGEVKGGERMEEWVWKQYEEKRCESDVSGQGDEEGAKLKVDR